MQARLRGELEATGEYIANVDSDDWVEPDTYATLYEQAKRDDADCVVMGYQRDYKDHTETCHRIFTETNGRDLIHNLYKYNFELVAWGELMRNDDRLRVLLQQYQRAEWEHATMWEDVAVMMPYYYGARRISYCDRYLYHYNRMNVSSALNTVSLPKAQQAVGVMRYLKKVFDDDPQMRPSLGALTLGAKNMMLGKVSLQEWRETEAWCNKDIMKYKSIPLRTRLFYKLLVFKQEWAWKLYKKKEAIMQKSDIILTVRTTAYNHERYIRDCLEGIVMQKTNFRFEAVVHDDCSTDNTASIIREYAAKYPDIIKPIYEEENQYSKGVNSQMNTKMNALTHGKYIAICEGDDYWTDPTKLQRQVDFLESHPEYSMCFHDVEVKAEVGREWYDCFGKIEDREYKALELIRDWKVPTCSMVIRREVYEKRPVNSKFRMGDNVLVMTCLSNGKVWGMNRKMGVYRLNPGSWLDTHKGKRNCYDFISHYKGMMEEFPLCRCQQMYNNIENKYFELMAILKKEGNQEEFERVKNDYLHYPGTTHMDKFDRYYRIESLRHITKLLLGPKISKLVSVLKTRLGLNEGRSINSTI